MILTLPDKAHMERKVIIGATPHRVYQEFVSFRGFSEWWPWLEEASRIKYSMEGPDFGIGSKFKWVCTDPDVGMGFAEIMTLKKDSLIVHEMGFEGYQGSPIGSFLLKPVSEGTEVIWAYDESELTGLSKLFMLGIDGFLGSHYEQGLAGLKKRVESSPGFQYASEIVLKESFSYLGIEDTTLNDPAMISAKMAQNYGQIVSYLYQNAIEMEGPPMVVYNNDNPMELVFTCGVPVNETTTVLSDASLKVFKMDSLLVLKTVYFGSYDGLGKAHQEARRFADFFKYQIAGAFWEEYVSDGELISDTSQWQTNIYYPIK